MKITFNEYRTRKNVDGLKFNVERQWGCQHDYTASHGILESWGFVFLCYKTNELVFLQIELTWGHGPWCYAP